MTSIHQSTSKPVPVFLLAVWFGLAAGLLEAFAFLLCDSFRISSWQTDMRGVDADILWASPAMDLFVCLLIACVLKPLVRPLGRHAFGVAVATFATVGFYALVAVPGRLNDKGAFVLALGLGTVVSRWMKRDADVGLRRLKRTLVPLVVSTALLGAGVVFGTRLVDKIEYARLPAPRPNAPNVLLIVLDTLRADRLGCYGYHLPTTPFLDRYAHGAVLFEKAFANAPWTLPSHVSFFTGYLPSAHGAVLYPYDGRFPTLGQVMADNGYATAGIVSNVWFGGRVQGFARGFIHWENGFTDLLDSAVRTSLGLRFDRHFSWWFLVAGTTDHILADDVNRRTLRWLDSRPHRPFFLFLNYMDVHDPLAPPRRFAEKFSAQPEILSPPVHMVPLWESGVSKLLDIPHLNEAYDASLASLDEQLGKLFEELRRRDLERNTLVIIVGDHGEALGQHGFRGHWTTVYREQIQVPLLVRLPGVTPEGARVASIAGLQNLPATIAELTGIPHAPFPGVSLSRWWQGTPPEERMVVSELDRPQKAAVTRNAEIAKGWWRSLSDDHWHLIVQQNGSKKLFNLDEDTAEEKNLADLPESQPRVAEMQNALEKLLGYRLFRQGAANANAGK